MAAHRFAAPLAAVAVALATVALATVALATLVTASARTAADPTQPVSADTATADAVPPPCEAPAPSTAAGYQAMFDAKNDATWSGGDQATSAPLPDGRILWLFGDTAQGREAADGGYEPSMRLVHNSLLLQDGGCLEAVNGPDGQEVIPDAPNGDFFWPQQAVVDGGRLVVLALRVARTGPGALDFATRGMEAAVFSLPATPGDAPRFEGLRPTPSSGSPDTSPQYGAAAVSDGTYHYLYGTARVVGPYQFGKAVYVARVPAGALLNVGAWGYWTGQEWSAKPASARPIIESAPKGWSTAFTVLRAFDGSYRMVTKENDFLGTDVITGVATSPMGPFTRTTVGEYPSFAVPGQLLYLAAAHPQAPVDGGLLGTVNRNTDNLSALRRDADLYKPQFFLIRDP